MVLLVFIWLFRFLLFPSGIYAFLPFVIYILIIFSNSFSFTYRACLFLLYLIYFNRIIISLFFFYFFFLLFLYPFWIPQKSFYLFYPSYKLLFFLSFLIYFSPYLSNTSKNFINKYLFSLVSYFIIQLVIAFLQLYLMHHFFKYTYLSSVYPSFSCKFIGLSFFYSPAFGVLQFMNYFYSFFAVCFYNNLIYWSLFLVEQNFPFKILGVSYTNYLIFITEITQMEYGTNRKQPCCRRTRVLITEQRLVVQRWHLLRLFLPVQ